MVDGIPFNDPFFRTVDWARIPKNSIESLEVIRGGGATSLWGNLAMGGVVNIVTRPPQDDKLSVYADYGSYNTLNTGFQVHYLKLKNVDGHQLRLLPDPRLQRHTRTIS